MQQAFAATTGTTAKGLSFLEVFSSASPMVVFVLLLLIVFSFLTWGIIFGKWLSLRKAGDETDEFLHIFWSGKSMDHIFGESKKMSSAPVAKLFQAGYVELQKLIERERKKGHKEPAPAVDTSHWVVPPESSLSNLERALTRANRSETMVLERSLTFLATTGSTAPFIGLFGTVWGIMNSFHSIGAEGGASLAVVAPGIAEALIATAVGLGAAIPAVMGYNYYSHRIRSIRIQMENFTGDFLNIVRRNFLAG